MARLKFRRHEELKKEFEKQKLVSNVGIESVHPGPPRPFLPAGYQARAHVTFGRLGGQPV